MGVPSRTRPDRPPVIPQPDGAGLSRLPVLVPPPHGCVEAVLLGQYVWGVAMHYDPSRPGYYPCPLGDNPCDGCTAHLQRPRWVGYCHAVLVANGRQYALSVSSEAFGNCEALWSRQGELRGTVVRLTRPGKGKVGRVVASVRGQYPDDQIPPGREIRCGLCLGWGMAADWWEWFVGLEPSGVPCPTVPESIKRLARKGERA